MPTGLEARSRPDVDRSPFTIIWFPPEAFLACNSVDARTGGQGSISRARTKTRTTRTFQHGRRARCTGALGAYRGIVHEDSPVLPPAPPERSGHSCSIRTAR